MDEASENFMEVDDLFNGIPQTINSSGGGSILRNDQMHEWRNGDLTQWFDGAIDVIGSHEVVGTRLNDGPLQTYNPWSVIEEPIVLTRGNPYHIDYNDSYGADKLPLNAAEMLQIPVTSGQDAAYVDSWSSTDSGSPMLPSNLAVEFLQDDMINGGADPMELAIKGLSGSVRSTSLQVDGMEFDDEGQKGVATHAAYKMLGSSTYPQSMVEFSMHYAGMLQPPFRLGAGHPQNMVEIPMQSGGMVPPPFRLGAGRVARKKMTHAWWQRGKSTFVIPDNIKMREDRDIMMTIEPGPRDTLQPMQRVVPPGGSRWAEQLLNLCAGAIADGNVARTQHLMWVLNELASFTGDGNERLAAYGLKALFCRITQGTSEATYLRPFHHQEKQLGPKAVHKALVTFHEFNPWHQISYTVTNEALMDVFAGKNHLHIVDIGVMKGLQWPTLIDALANRPGGPPTKLRITTLRHHNKWAPFTHNDQVDAESADFMRRLVTFAKVLGFNCELNLYAGPMECFREKDLKLEEGEVNAELNSLKSVNQFSLAVSRAMWCRILNSNLMILFMCLQADFGGLLSVSITQTYKPGVTSSSSQLVGSATYTSRRFFGFCSLIEAEFVHSERERCGHALGTLSHPVQGNHSLLVVFLRIHRSVLQGEGARRAWDRRV